jgi:2-deoxy-D-gluconate 3-dehydrogenase
MSDKVLAGKVAIVTGGNGGIGLGMAKGLAAAGAKLVIAARNQEKSAKAVAELRALGAEAMAVVLDVASEASIKAMADATLKAYGRIDILVANAGINIRKTPELLELSEWQQVIDSNLTGPFLCSKACYPAMKAAGGGKIIVIGSMSSIFGLPFAPAYSATKGGIVQLARAIATAWAKDNIQVNAVLPGWIDTDLTKSARQQVAGLNERVVARTPAGRWGEPADFAGIAVFLSSKASDFVTGTAIPVDGGYSINGG